jgi:hypothetical protein
MEDPILCRFGDFRMQPCYGDPCGPVDTELIPENAAGTYDHCNGTQHEGFCPLVCLDGFTPESGPRTGFECYAGQYDRDINATCRKLKGCVAPVFAPLRAYSVELLPDRTIRNTIFDEEYDLQNVSHLARFHVQCAEGFEGRGIGDAYPHLARFTLQFAILCLRGPHLRHRLYGSRDATAAS